MYYRKGRKRGEGVDVATNAGVVWFGAQSYSVLLARLLSDDVELPKRCSFAKHVTERGKDERRKEGASAWPRSSW